MYFVYYGYVSPDNYDASNGPTYKIKECQSVHEVVLFKKEFEESLHDECANIIFRVFEGSERFLAPKEVIISYELK